MGTNQNGDAHNTRKDTSTSPQARPVRQPNVAMLAALARARIVLQGVPPAEGDTTLESLRRARAGGMYADDSE